LGFASAYLRRFTFRENITHINQPLRLHREAPILNRYFNEVTFLKLQSLEERPGDYHLTSLADPAYLHLC